MKYTRRATTFVQGEYTVLLRRHGRFTDSNDDVRVILTNNITRAEWRWNRIGGCGDASFEISTDTTFAAPADHLFTVNHNYLQEADLYGGMVEVWVKLFPDVPSVLTDKTANRVYMGRIRRIDTDRKNGNVSISCEGLGSAFDETFVDEDFEDKSIRTIVTDIVDPLIKGTLASGNDGPLFGKTIVAATSLIDQILPIIKARGEEVSEILEKAISFLPGRYVWGVDVNGFFFLQPQDEAYDARNEQLPVDSYILSQGVVNWSRRVRLDKIISEVQVQGKLNEDTGFRITGSAQSARLREMFGLRQEVITDSDITEASLAGKLAQAEARERSNTVVEGELTVDEQIHPQKSFRHSLVEFAAPVLVSESGQVTRVMGDTIGNALYLEGTSNSLFDIAEKSQYQRTATWLMHIDIRFEAAPQLVGFNMVFGQQNTNMQADGLHGWGIIYWDSVTGNLQWGYTTPPSNNVARGMAINVPVAGPFPITVKLTVALDDTGTLSFYDNITIKRRVGAGAAVGTGGIWANPWRGAKSYFGAHGETKLSFNNFSFFDASAWVPALGATYTDAFDNWVLANAGNRLNMAWGTGLVSWAEMVELQDAITSMPVKYGEGSAAADEGLSKPDLTFTKLASEVGKSIVNGDGPQSPEWYQGKTWGGPLVLNHKSVRYMIQPRLGRVRKRIELGSKELNLPNLVAQTDREVKLAKAVLKKTAQDA